MDALGTVRDTAVGLGAELQATSLRDRRAAIALRPVFSVGLAVAVAHALDLQDTWWSAITAFVVTQPDFDTSFKRDARVSVTQRMVQRVTGCFIAGALAFAPLPLIDGQYFWSQLALFAGLWIGAYRQAGRPSVRDMSVQFSVAFLMVFVQDRGWTVEPAQAAQRLGGVLAGIASLSLVMFAFDRVAAARSRA
ncbi:hypothetical protein BH09PSE5_BH09PSE5_36300 [soil metagenome]